MLSDELSTMLMKSYPSGAFIIQWVIHISWHYPVKCNYVVWKWTWIKDIAKWFHNRNLIDNTLGNQIILRSCLVGEKWKDYWMNFKTYGCLVRGIRGVNGFDEGFKILNRTPILIPPTSEGLEEGIHTKHNEWNILPVFSICFT